MREAEIRRALELLEYAGVQELRCEIRDLRREIGAAGARSPSVDRALDAIAEAERVLRQELKRSTK